MTKDAEAMMKAAEERLKRETEAFTGGMTPRAALDHLTTMLSEKLRAEVCVQALTLSETDRMAKRAVHAQVLSKMISDHAQTLGALVVLQKHLQSRSLAGSAGTVPVEPKADISEGKPRC